MKTYLKQTEYYAGKSLNTKLEIFSGDIESDKEYNKRMGYSVRYFQIKEVLK